MLALTFRLGGRRHAADARQVVEVLPLLPLQGAPGAPGGPIGLLAYAARAIPIFDMGSLLYGCACEPLLSTRIILVRGPAGEPDAPATVGLVAGSVVEFADLDDGGKPRLGRIPGRREPYLGPVVQSGDDLIQLIDLESLAASACGHAPTTSGR
jgi:chemotaxis-related protein WspB